MRIFLLLFISLNIQSFCTYDEEDLYELLGVPRSASEQHIRKAFKQQARAHHPDRSHDEHDMHERTRMFQRINHAHSTLTNPELRRLYDQDHPAFFCSCDPFVFIQHISAWLLAQE